MYRLVDMKVDSEGDLELDGSGDVKLATPAESLKQEILFRLNTEHSDYVPDPFIGANLRSAVGGDNNENASLAVMENMFISLTQDGLIPNSLLFLDAVPLSKKDIGVLVMYSGLVEGEQEAVVISGTIDIEDLGTNNESILNTSVI